ncbi:MAG: LamG-like jellyroll fold domain-containing protein [Bacteroidota bacterium]
MRHFSTNLLSIFTFLFLSTSSSFGQAGYGLDFNGTDEYVEVPYNSDLNPSGSFTIECWVKVEGGSGTFRSPITSRQVISAGTLARGYILYAGSDDQWQFWTGTNTTTWSQVNSGVAVSSEWTHVAGTFDGTTLRIYVNGQLASSGAGTYVVNPDRPLRIGSGGTESSSPLFYLPGQVDEVRIWSDERTGDEIRANMHKELTGSESNLVGYYQMSDGSGSSLTDNSTNSNSGTLTNSPTWKTSGAMTGSGMSLDFDGSTNYVEVPYNSGLNPSTFTLECWVKVDGGSGTVRSPMTSRQSLSGATNNTGYMIYAGSDNQWSFWTGDGGSGWEQLNSGVAVSSEWTHLACVHDGTRLKMYINGVFADTISGGYVANPNRPLQIGVGGGDDALGSLDFYFPGQLDEVRIWSDERTVDEIRANMFRTLEGNEAGLEAYYRFDQQPDALHSTLYDYTSNGNDGTLTNMTPASDWVSSDPFNTWIGAEDSDWGNADNWSLGSVPSTENVGIFDWDGSNDPASGNISGKDLYLGTGISSSHSGNLTLSGNIYNDGTFSTSGNVTFSGTTAQLVTGSGTTNLGNLTLNNGSGLTLEQNVTTSDLTLTNGVLTIGANTLTIEGAISQTSGSLTGGSNSNITIAGSGASTTLPALSLNNLTLNRANGASLGGAITMEGQLTLSNGLLNLNSQTLTLGDVATSTGGGSSTYIIATSGTLRKEFSSNGSFAYPVGDATYYSPMTLNFTSGGYSSAYADVSLTAIKHPNNTSTSHFLTRYWTVSSSGISSFSCDVTAVYDDNDVTGTESSISGVKWNGIEWSLMSGINTTTNTITGTVSSFSDFSGGEPAALPVEWLSFNAFSTNGQVTLSWETASELNSDFFAVERSRERTDWVEIGRVGGSGFSDDVQAYTYTDNKATSGQTYYRLRQVDFDGQFEYSEVRTVYVDPQLRVYPNPVNAVLQLELPAGRWSAKLIDINGREILRRNEVGTTLNMQSLAVGIYQLILTNDEGESVIKQLNRQ